MIHLNELPPYLLVKIFSYLPIGEVIRLKLVCKAWQELSSYVRFQSLRLYRYDYEGVNDEAIRKPERFPERFDVYVNDFERFFQATSSMVRGVKRLAVCLFNHPINYENNRLENFLHRFRMLEELELKVPGYVFGEEPGLQFNLKFERLRKLQLKYRRRSFEINCPELIYFDFGESRETNCHIRHPEKLRTLVVDGDYDKKNFKKFVNLRNLVIDLSLSFWETNPFNETFLAGLPNTLKRLIFSGCGIFRGEYTNSLDLEAYLRESYAADQEDPNLRIFYCGIELSRSRFTDNEEEPFLSNFSNEISEFMITNLANSVDANFSLNGIEYDVLEKHLTSFDLLYKKMYWKDSYFSVTVCKNVADQDRFFRLIEKLKPYHMELMEAVGFPRQFFERLTEIVSPCITNLSFSAVNLSEPGALDFLLKMTQLWEVTVWDCPLTLTESLDLLIAAFEKIKTLIYFGFTWQPSSSFTFIRSYYHLEFSYTDEKGASQKRDIYYNFEEYNQNGLDVLKCLNARMKQINLLKMPTADQLTKDQLAFFCLIEEFKRQAQFNQLAFDVIVDCTKSQEVDLDSKLKTLKRENFDLYEFDVELTLLDRLMLDVRHVVNL